MYDILSTLYQSEFCQRNKRLSIFITKEVGSRGSTNIGQSRKAVKDKEGRGEIGAWGS